MPPREDPLNLDTKLRHPRTSWLPLELATRLDACAAALGWTTSRLQRWLIATALPSAERHAAKAPKAPKAGGR